MQFLSENFFTFLPRIHHQRGSHSYIQVKVHHDHCSLSQFCKQKWSYAAHTVEVRSAVSHQVVPKLSKSCPKAVTELSQGCPKNCLKVVSRMSQSCLKVVSSLSQSCLKVVSVLCRLFLFSFNIYFDLLLFLWKSIYLLTEECM